MITVTFTPANSSARNPFPCGDDTTIREMMGVLRINTKDVEVLLNGALTTDLEYELQDGDSVVFRTIKVKNGNGNG